MGPVTENPFLVAIINMVVVFGVLIVLGVLMHVIEMIDPTKKKVTSKAAAPAAAVAAPAAAVAAPAAAVAAPVAKDNSEEIAAVIAAAVAAAGGSENVAMLRIVNKAAAWTINARAEAIQACKP